MTSISIDLNRGGWGQIPSTYKTYVVLAFVQKGTEGCRMKQQGIWWTQEQENPKLANNLPGKCGKQIWEQQLKLRGVFEFSGYKGPKMNSVGLEPSAPHEFSKLTSWSPTLRTTLLGKELSRMETTGAKKKRSDEVGEGDSTGDLIHETRFDILPENRRGPLPSRNSYSSFLKVLFYMKMITRQGSNSQILTEFL